jgi:predicted DNA-binding transcriptional regulator AlpA
MTEVARVLGLSQADIWQLAHSAGFPAAAAEHAGRPLWATKDIEAWVAATRGRRIPTSMRNSVQAVPQGEWH